MPLLNVLRCRTIVLTTLIESKYPEYHIALAAIRVEEAISAAVDPKILEIARKHLSDPLFDAEQERELQRSFEVFQQDKPKKSVLPFSWLFKKLKPIGKRKPGVPTQAEMYKKLKQRSLELQSTPESLE
jgi:hypothetical protein